ncbi:hemerythrin domain-containing protein [Zhongshania guokunii]|uniref:Hemerythrin domain-containing protein n=1 Tax=Zhongshania guokunii TaxID=641783 RepID=A0ABV3U5X7_9GAMM
MHYLLEQLEQDHHRILRMMYVLSKEINQLTGLNKGTANCDRILEILDYIQVYPEVWHHPTEDVLFQQLLTKEHINTVAVKKLLNEHPRLEALSSQLALIYSEFREVKARPSLRVLQLSRYYCSKQIAHIHDERNIFDAISVRFNEQDWQTVNNALRESAAPDDERSQIDYICRSNHLNQNQLLTSSGLH